MLDDKDAEKMLSSLDWNDSIDAYDLKNELVLEDGGENMQDVEEDDSKVSILDILEEIQQIQLTSDDQAETVFKGSNTRDGLAIPTTLLKQWKQEKILNEDETEAARTDELIESEWVKMKTQVSSGTLKGAPSTFATNSKDSEDDDVNKDIDVDVVIDMAEEGTARPCSPPPAFLESQNQFKKDREEWLKTRASGGGDQITFVELRGGFENENQN